MHSPPFRPRARHCISRRAPAHKPRCRFRPQVLPPIPDPRCSPSLRAQMTAPAPLVPSTGAFLRSRAWFTDCRHDPQPQAWALQAQPTPIPIPSPPPSPSRPHPHPHPNARLPLGLQMIPDGRPPARSGARSVSQTSGVILQTPCIYPPSRPQPRPPAFRHDTETPGAPDPKAQVTSPTPGRGSRSPEGRPPRPGTVPHPGSRAQSPRPSPTAGCSPTSRQRRVDPDPRAFPSYQAPVPPRPWAPPPTSGSGSPSRMVIHPPGVQAPLRRRPGEAHTGMARGAGDGGGTGPQAAPDGGTQARERGGAGWERTGPLPTRSGPRRGGRGTDL